MLPKFILFRNAFFFLVCLAFLTTAHSQALKVPFYDDFSKPGLLTPDTTLWLPSGVTLNNSYAIAPPTQFVATFDGRDRFGTPYDFAISNSFGATDSLVSKPIDLSLITADSLLVLSFFYQAKGLGDLPDPEDSLIVRFKNQDSEWINVWRNDEITTTDSFTQVFLPVNDSAFLHGSFQFAFVTKGRQSGPFDVWHLDYVFLETQSKRAVEEGFYTDISVQDIPTPILKNYRSMPIRQFRANADHPR